MTTRPSAPTIASASVSAEPGAQRRRCAHAAPDGLDRRPAADRLGHAPHLPRSARPVAGRRRARRDRARTPRSARGSAGIGCHQLVVACRARRPHRRPGTAPRRRARWWTGATATATTVVSAERGPQVGQHPRLGGRVERRRGVVEQQQRRAGAPAHGRARCADAARRTGRHRARRRSVSSPSGSSCDELRPRPSASAASTASSSDGRRRA